MLCMFCFVFNDPLTVAQLHGSYARKLVVIGKGRQQRHVLIEDDNKTMFFILGFVLCTLELLGFGANDPDTLFLVHSVLERTIFIFVGIY